jgi:hypothetical protein
MKKSPENLRDLSPFVLKRRVQKLRQELAQAEAAVPQAKEKDRQEHLSMLRRWEEARLELIQLRPKLEASREKIKDNSTLLDYAIEMSMDWLLSRDRTAENAAKRASYLEHQQLYEEITNLEKRLGLNFHTDPVPTADQNPLIQQAPFAFHGSAAQRRLDHVRAELERHLKALGGDSARLERLVAVEARVLQRERDLAAKLRLTCTPTGDCPYCGGALGNGARLDHIYPVAKGGLSVPTNLVFVCLRCNQQKSDMTLAAFLRAYNLDRAAVEERLAHLGKDF